MNEEGRGRSVVANQAAGGPEGWGVRVRGRRGRAGAAGFGGAAPRAGEVAGRPARAAGRGGTTSGLATDRATGAFGFFGAARFDLTGRAGLARRREAGGEGLLRPADAAGFSLFGGFFAGFALFLTLTAAMAAFTLH